MKSRIPVYEPWLRPEDSEAVARAVRSGWVSSAGAELRAFEEQWASYCGRTHGVGVSSGTAALELTLEAAGLGSGDEVLCPTFTIISCALAIVRVGAIPVLVDSDPRTYCMDAEGVRAKVTDRTAAILAVHMYGHPVAPDVVELARDRSLLLIEDAAEAHGAELRLDDRWVRCGGVGDLSVQQGDHHRRGRDGDDER
jgi:perosamine synthetase